LFRGEDLLALAAVLDQALGAPLGDADPATG
jgi:hypothetical protein